MTDDVRLTPPSELIELGKRADLSIGTTSAAVAIMEFEEACVESAEGYAKTLLDIERYCRSHLSNASSPGQQNACREILELMEGKQ